MSEKKDSRVFPPEIADKTEEERFKYYISKARRALQTLDTKRKRDELKRELLEDDPGSLTNAVRWLRELQERGPGDGPQKGLADRLNEDLRRAVEDHYRTVEHLEASIGRHLLEAIKSGDNEPIETARTIIREDREWTAPPRILLRRIVRTLQEFYHAHKCVPTKGELFKALDDYPVDSAAVTITPKTYTVKTTFDSPPQKVNPGQFSNALQDLGLRDLPQGQSGNPNLRNRLDEK